MRQLKRACEEYDATGGMKIDDFVRRFGELVRAHAPHVTEDELRHMFQRVDANANGSVDWDELATFLLMNEDRQTLRQSAHERLRKYAHVPLSLDLRQIPEYRLLRHNHEPGFRMLIHPTLQRAVSVSGTCVKIWDLETMTHVATPLVVRSGQIVDAQWTSPNWGCIVQAAKVDRRAKEKEAAREARRRRSNAGTMPHHSSGDDDDDLNTAGGRGGHSRNGASSSQRAAELMVFDVDHTVTLIDVNAACVSRVFVGERHDSSKTSTGAMIRAGQRRYVSRPPFVVPLSRSDDRRLKFSDHTIGQAGTVDVVPPVWTHFVKDHVYEATMLTDLGYVAPVRRSRPKHGGSAQLPFVPHRPKGFSASSQGLSALGLGDGGVDDALDRLGAKGGIRGGGGSGTASGGSNAFRSPTSNVAASRNPYGTLSGCRFSRRRSAFPTSGDYVHAPGSTPRLFIGLSNGVVQQYDDAMHTNYSSASSVAVRLPCRGHFQVHDAYISRLICVPASDMVLSASWDGTVKVGSIERFGDGGSTLGEGALDLDHIHWTTDHVPSYNTQFRGHVHGITTMDYNPVLKLIATGAPEPDALIWSPFIPKPLASLHVTESTGGGGLLRGASSRSKIQSIKFASLANEVLTLSLDGTVRIWDLRVYRCVAAYDHLSDRAVPERQRRQTNRGRGGDGDAASADDGAVAGGWHTARKSAAAKKRGAVDESSQTGKDGDDDIDDGPATASALTELQSQPGGGSSAAKKKVATLSSRSAASSNGGDALSSNAGMLFQPDPTELPLLGVYDIGFDDRRSSIVTLGHNVCRWPASSASKGSADTTGHAAAIVSAVVARAYGQIISADAQQVIVWDIPSGLAIMRWQQSECTVPPSILDAVAVVTHTGGSTTTSSSAARPSLTSAAVRDMCIDTNDRRIFIATEGGQTQCYNYINAYLMKSCLPAASTLQLEVSAVAFGEQERPRPALIIVQCYENGLASIHLDDDGGEAQPQRVVKCGGGRVHGCKVVAPSLVVFALKNGVSTYNLEEVGDRCQVFTPLPQQQSNGGKASEAPTLLFSRGCPALATILSELPYFLKPQGAEQRNAKRSMNRLKGTGGGGPVAVGGGGKAGGPPSRAASMRSLSHLHHHGHEEDDQPPTASITAACGFGGAAAMGAEDHSHHNPNDTTQHPLAVVEIDDATGDITAQALQDQVSHTAETQSEAVEVLSVGRIHPVAVTGMGDGTLRFWDCKQQLELDGHSCRGTPIVGDGIVTMHVEPRSHDLLLAGDVAGYVAMFDVVDVGKRYAYNADTTTTGVASPAEGARKSVIMLGGSDAAGGQRGTGQHTATVDDATMVVPSASKAATILSSTFPRYVRQDESTLVAWQHPVRLVCRWRPHLGTVTSVRFAVDQAETPHDDGTTSETATGRDPSSLSLSLSPSQAAARHRQAGHTAWDSHPSSMFVLTSGNDRRVLLWNLTRESIATANPSSRASALPRGISSGLFVESTAANSTSTSQSRTSFVATLFRSFGDSLPAPPIQGFPHSTAVANLIDVYRRHAILSVLRTADEPVSFWDLHRMFIGEPSEEVYAWAQQLLQEEDERLRLQRIRNGEIPDDLFVVNRPASPAREGGKTPTPPPPPPLPPSSSSAQLSSVTAPPTADASSGGLLPSNRGMPSTVTADDQAPQLPVAPAAVPSPQPHTKGATQIDPSFFKPSSAPSPSTGGGAAIAGLGSLAAEQESTVALHPLFHIWFQPAPGHPEGRPAFVLRRLLSELVQGSGGHTNASSGRADLASGPSGRLGTIASPSAHPAGVTAGGPLVRLCAGTGFTATFQFVGKALPSGLFKAAATAASFVGLRKSMAAVAAFPSTAAALINSPSQFDVTPSTFGTAREHDDDAAAANSTTPSSHKDSIAAHSVAPRPSNSSRPASSSPAGSGGSLGGGGPARRRGNERQTNPAARRSPPKQLSVSQLGGQPSNALAVTAMSGAEMSTLSRRSAVSSGTVAAATSSPGRTAMSAAAAEVDARWGRAHTPRYRVPVVTVDVGDAVAQRAAESMATLMSVRQTEPLTMQRDSEGQDETGGVDPQCLIDDHRYGDNEGDEEDEVVGGARADVARRRLGTPSTVLAAAGGVTGLPVRVPKLAINRPIPSGAAPYNGTRDGLVDHGHHAHTDDHHPLPHDLGSSVAVRQPPSTGRRGVLSSVSLAELRLRNHEAHEHQLLLARRLADEEEGIQSASRTGYAPFVPRAIPSATAAPLSPVAAVPPRLIRHATTTSAAAASESSLPLSAEGTAEAPSSSRLPIATAADPLPLGVGGGIGTGGAPPLHPDFIQGTVTLESARRNCEPLVYVANAVPRIAPRLPAHFPAVIGGAGGGDADGSRRGEDKNETSIAGGAVAGTKGGVGTDPRPMRPFQPPLQTARETGNWRNMSEVAPTCNCHKSTVPLTARKPTGGGAAVNLNSVGAPLQPPGRPVASASPENASTSSSSPSNSSSSTPKIRDVRTSASLGRPSYGTRLERPSLADQFTGSALAEAKRLVATRDAIRDGRPVTVRDPPHGTFVTPSEWRRLDAMGRVTPPTTAAAGDGRPPSHAPHSRGGGGAKRSPPVGKKGGGVAIGRGGGPSAAHPIGGDAAGVGLFSIFSQAPFEQDATVAVTRPAEAAAAAGGEGPEEGASTKVVSADDDSAHASRLPSWRPGVASVVADATPFSFEQFTRCETVWVEQQRRAVGESPAAADIDPLPQQRGAFPIPVQEGGSDDPAKVVGERQSISSITMPTDPKKNDAATMMKPNDGGHGVLVTPPARRDLAGGRDARGGSLVEGVTTAPTTGSLPSASFKLATSFGSSPKTYLHRSVSMMEAVTAMSQSGGGEGDTSDASSPTGSLVAVNRRRALRRRASSMVSDGDPASRGSSRGGRRKSVRGGPSSVNSDGAQEDTDDILAEVEAARLRSAVPPPGLSRPPISFHHAKEFRSSMGTLLLGGGGLHTADSAGGKLRSAPTLPRHAPGGDVEVAGLPLTARGSGASTPPHQQQQHGTGLPTSVTLAVASSAQSVAAAGDRASRHLARLNRITTGAGGATPAPTTDTAEASSPTLPSSCSNRAVGNDKKQELTWDIIRLARLHTEIGTHPIDADLLAMADGKAMARMTAMNKKPKLVIGGSAAQNVATNAGMQRAPAASNGHK